MQEKPYFCPNCRSNRVKFSVITRSAQSFMKDAISGEVTSNTEAEEFEQSEPDIQCNVCSFVGNEMRFIKQAEREPRTQTMT
jgi:DNA-directed RNA polymerase subunit RPC12/RpoP